jgi:DNA-binding FadR family transcriptional regulator
MAVKEKLADRITAQIREHIAEGRFPVNHKMPTEQELMELYGVGRSTIREAIKTLAVSGLVTVQQGSGTIVNEALQTESIDDKLKRANFSDIHAVRKLLEEEIVRLAATHRSEHDLAEMRQYLEKRKLAILAEKAKECAAEDIAFHMTIAQASGNKVLADLYKSFTSIIRDSFSRREQRGIMHFAMNHHRHENLYMAIAEAQPEKACAEILSILEDGY